jgi:2-alkyl-3-oxoalkanoate reductase
VKLFVTGATGFIGTAVVRTARLRGHDVVALVRGDRTSSDSGIRYVRGDVRHPAPWSGELAGVDAVIHLAASFDDLHSQLAVNVLGTEHLLKAMTANGCRRLIHVSSLSVYDYTTPAAGSVLDERSAIEPRPADRDAYAETKVFQEELVRQFAADGGLVTIVRPGAVYGPDRLWNGGLVTRLFGPMWLAVGPETKPKLAHVDNCAEAMVMCAEIDASIGETMNLLDDELPTQRQFLAALKERGLFSARSIPVPYKVFEAGTKLLQAVNVRRWKGNAQVPSFMHPDRLAASNKPFEYPNAHAKKVLGWTPKHNYKTALDDIARRVT